MVPEMWNTPMWEGVWPYFDPRPLRVWALHGRTRLSTCPLACRLVAAHRRGDELMGGSVHWHTAVGLISTGRRLP